MPILYRVIAMLACLAACQSWGQGGGFSTPDRFSQSIDDLFRSTRDGVTQRSGLGPEFDALGNRLSTLTPLSFVAPIDIQAEYTSRPVARNLGDDALVSYRPILPLVANPYQLQPSLRVLRRLGPYDLMRPTLSYSIQHDSNVPLLNSTTPSDGISQNFTTEILIQSSPDRPSRIRLSTGYRPTYRQFLTLSGLNALDHRAFLGFSYPMRKITLSSASTFASSTTPNPLSAARVRRRDISQSLSIDYEFSSKSRISLSPRITSSVSAQGLPSLIGLVPGAPAGGSVSSKTYSLLGAYTLQATERVNFTSNLGYQYSDQSTGIANSPFPDQKTTQINAGVGYSHILTQKLSIQAAAGFNISSGNTSDTAPPTPYYSIGIEYLPTPNWGLGVQIERSKIADPLLGAVTENVTYQIQLRRRIYRELTFTASTDWTTQTVDASSTPLGSDLSIPQRTLSMGLATPISSRTKLSLNYRDVVADIPFGQISSDNRTVEAQVRYDF